MQLDITNANCSTTPLTNDWEKLGMSKDEATAISALLCPKAVHMILTGGEIQKVMRDCVEEKTRIVVLDNGLSGKPRKLSPIKKQTITDALSTLAQHNLQCISASEPLIGVQFIITGCKYTPYIATRFVDDSFVAAFKGSKDGNTVAVFCTSQPSALEYARTLGAKFHVPCAFCGSTVGLKKCARCMGAMYCSKECQTQHWAEHKRGCRG